MLGAALISYNDIIPAQIVVTGKNPPVALKSFSSGKLSNIFVKPGQAVAEEALLAEIENNADIDDVYYLKKKLVDIELSAISLDSLNRVFPSRLNLGDLQSSFDKFVTSYQDYILLNPSVSNKNFPISKSQKEELEIIYRQQLERAYKQLDNDLMDWERKYIFKSPIDGKVAVFDIWNRHQNVSVGETIFTIVPDDPEEIIGHGSLPTQNSGKVKVGQKAIIKLDNYPFQEWGSLEGRISYISEVPRQDEHTLYTLYIEIESLTTSFDKQLHFKQEMQGTAEIIIEELSILERIFYQLRETFSR